MECRNYPGRGREAEKAGKWQVVMISSEAVAPAGVKGGSHAGEKMTGYPPVCSQSGKKTAAFIFTIVNI